MTKKSIMLTTESTEDEIINMFDTDRNIFTVRDITDDVVKKYTGNTTGYDKSKATVVSNFFLSLSKNKKLKFLTVEDAKNGREHFFNLTAYKRGEAVMKIINTSLCCWANFLVLKRYKGKNLDELTTFEYHAAQYQPSTVATMDKQLWAVFRWKVSLFYTVPCFLMVVWFLKLVISLFFIGYWI